MNRGAFFVVAVTGTGFVAFAALYLLAPAAYLTILGWYGFEPYPRPFLDTDALTAAVECARRGVDVYRVNPCDMLGRPHVYSPLWLAAAILPVTRGWTMGLGLGIDLLFIASLAWLPVASSGRDKWLLAAASVSYMSAYALERANNDLVVFVLVIAACHCFRRDGPPSWAGYGLILLAGLLKFYPLVGLIALAREKTKIMAALGAGALLVVFCLAWPFRAELALVLALIPHGAMDMFGARHLSNSLRILLTLPDSSLPMAVRIATNMILVLLILASVWRLIRLARLDELHRGYRALPQATAMPLLLGATLIMGCFVVGESGNYRGILLLPVLAGLLALRPGLTTDGIAGAACRETIWLILLLMWAEPVRTALRAALGRGGLADLLFWILLECLWWRLIAFLGAIILCFLAAAPAWRSFRRGPAL